MVKLLFFFLVSILISFLCSIWEAVILSISPTYVKRIQKEKPKIGKLLHQFKKDIDKPLSAVLTLNTIAHTVGAIGVGVQAGKIFGTNHIQFYFFDNTPLKYLILGSLVTQPYNRLYISYCLLMVYTVASKKSN